MTSYRRTPGNEERRVANSLNVATYAKRFPFGCWSYLGLGCEKKWYGTHSKPNGEWNGVAEIMMINFAESGHPTFQATCPLERGELKNKGGGKKTIHYNGSEETVELILRTVISVNQLSIYGVVADLCKELEPDSRTHTEGEICESLVIPTESADADATSQSSTSSAQGNLLQDYVAKIEDLLEDQKLSKLCKDAGFLKKIEKGQFLITIEEGSEVVQTACREYTQSRPRDWIRCNAKIGRVLDVKVYPHEGRYCIDIMIESLFKDRTVSWVRIVNGSNKYVTEEIPIENFDLFISTGKLVAKGKRRPKLVVNVSSNSVPIGEREWIDIDTQPFDHTFFLKCQNS